MKRLMYLAMLTVMLSFNSGCYLLDHVFSCHPCGFWHGGSTDCDSCGSCGSCGGGCGGGCSDGCASGGCGGCDACGGGGGYVSGPDDSMGGIVTYPYYTNRGPRDFLAKSPRSIGP